MGSGLYKLLSIGLVVLAFIVLALVGYDGVNRFVSWQESKIDENEEVEPASTSVRQQNYNISELINAHLFGEPPKQEVVQITEAPETKLRLNLLGMIASNDHQYARALISVNSNKLNAYKVGDPIEGTDATVYAVEENRVLLDRKGVMESLYLKRQDLFGNTG